MKTNTKSTFVWTKIKDTKNPWFELNEEKILKTDMFGLK